MRELPQLRRLGDDESLTSPSGRFTLHYDAEGVAVVTDRSTGEVRWRAGDEDRPAAGRLVLDGSVKVEAPGTYDVVWRSDIGVAGAHTLLLTDDGDFELLDGERVRRLNSRTGPVEVQVLGAEAPVAAITGERFLVREGKIRRTVVRNPDGTLQIAERGAGFGSSYSLIAPIVQWMEQPDTILTWRILPYDGRKSRELCLLDAGGAVLWREGMSSLSSTPPPAPPHVYGAAELGRGGRLRHQSLTSISGAYTLVHQDDGNLVLYSNPEQRAVWATDTWWAGDGWTDLTEDGDLVVRNLCGAPVWRSDTAGSDAQWLVVDDEGGVALLDDTGTAVWEIRTGESHGPAPAADPARGSVLRRGQTLRCQSLTSADGGTVLVHRDRRTVLFGEDGRPLWDRVSSVAEHGSLALGEDGVLRVQADDGAAVEELGGPGDELVVEPDAAVLRRADGTVVWRNGVRADETEEPPEEDFTSWLEALNDVAYCVTVIHDVDPDTALRRIGAEPSHITTGTWADLQERADLEEAGMDPIMAAFPLGPHTLIVEDNGYLGIRTPRPSLGTFAVSCYASVNGASAFLVYRDGEVVGDHSMEGGDEEATTPEVRRALAEMGADDVLDTAYEQDVELLCRTAGIRPTLADVSGPARIAIIES